MVLFFILESVGWGEVVVGIVGFFVVIWTLKFALPTQLFSTTSDLLDKRTTERDDALRERDAARKESLQLEEEIKTLRREVIQRMDISREDQETIRQLKQEINKLLAAGE